MIKERQVLYKVIKLTFVHLYLNVCAKKQLHVTTTTTTKNWTELFVDWENDHNRKFADFQQSILIYPQAFCL